MKWYVLQNEKQNQEEKHDYLKKLKIIISQNDLHLTTISCHFSLSTKDDKSSASFWNVFQKMAFCECINCWHNLFFMLEYDSKKQAEGK